MTNEIKKWVAFLKCEMAAYPNDEYDTETFNAIIDHLQATNPSLTADKLEEAAELKEHASTQELMRTAARELRRLPANNAELCHDRATVVSALIELRDWAKQNNKPYAHLRFGFIKELISTLSAAPEVAIQDKAATIPDKPCKVSIEQSNSIKDALLSSVDLINEGFIAEQPAMPSALADNLTTLEDWARGNSDNKNASVTALILAVTSQATQALRQNFDVLQDFRSGTLYCIHKNTNYRWVGSCVRYCVTGAEDDTWYTADGTDYMNIMRALMDDTFKPYTAPLVIVFSS